jgi:hypothetical protein
MSLSGESGELSHEKEMVQLIDPDRSHSLFLSARQAIASQPPKYSIFRDLV